MPLSLLQWWRLPILPLHIQHFSLCLHFMSPFFLLYSLPAACPPSIYTIILESFYTIYLTPPPSFFCIVLYSFQNFILLFVFSLPAPFSFILCSCRHRFISRFLEIMRWIVHSFARALQLFIYILRHLHHQDKLHLMSLYTVFMFHFLSL